MTETHLNRLARALYAAMPVDMPFDDHTDEYKAMLTGCTRAVLEAVCANPNIPAETELYIWELLNEDQP